MLIWNKIRCRIRRWGFLSIACVTLLNMALGNFQSATIQLIVIYLQHGSILHVFNLHWCSHHFVLIQNTFCTYLILKNCVLTGIGRTTCKLFQLKKKFWRFEPSWVIVSLLKGKYSFICCGVRLETQICFSCENHGLYSYTEKTKG